MLKVYLRMDKATWEGTILNYSESGVFVAASRTIAIDDTIRLRFRRPDDASVVEIKGVVKRVIAEPGSLGGDTGYGIHLLEFMSAAGNSKGASGVFERPGMLDSRPSLSGKTRKAGASAGAPAKAGAKVSGRASRARDSRFVTFIKAAFTPLTGQGVPLDGELVNVSRHGLFNPDSAAGRHGPLPAHRRLGRGR